MPAPEDCPASRHGERTARRHRHPGQHDGAPPLGELQSFETRLVKAIEQNLMYVVRMRACLAPYDQEGRGSILNITAISAIQPNPGLRPFRRDWSA